MTEVGKEYGTALYQLAAEEALEEQLLEELFVLKKLFAENGDYEKLLSTPVLPKAERLQIADQALKGKVHSYLLNFLKILIENNTVREFPSCCQQYEALYNKAHGIEKAVAVTAVPLSDALQQRLKEKLEQVTGKTILLQNRVDPSVLGGVRIELDGKQLNDSLRKRLDTLRENLLHVIA